MVQGGHWQTRLGPGYGLQQVLLLNGFLGRQNQAMRAAVAPVPLQLPWASGPEGGSNGLLKLVERCLAVQLLCKQSATLLK